jgi:predicted DNA-binding transcriptional regulator AlpA
MGDPNELLNESEAAKIPALTGHAFRKYRQLGIGPPYIKISARCVRYRRADVLAWLEARRVRPDATRRLAQATR